MGERIKQRVKEGMSVKTQGAAYASYGAPEQKNPAQ
jgi:hypothetical protein